MKGKGQVEGLVLYLRMFDKYGPMRGMRRDVTPSHRWIFSKTSQKNLIPSLAAYPSSKISDSGPFFLNKDCCFDTRVLHIKVQSSIICTPQDTQK